MLHRTLNRACRAVLDVKDIREPTIPMYKRLNWLPVKELFDYNIVVEMFRCLKGYNKYSITFPPIRANIHGYPTRNNTNFNIPIHNLAAMRKTFSVRGPLAWNNLDPNLKNINSLNLFKKRYKQMLLNQPSYNDI